MSDEKIKSGFNTGYYLAKNHPALFEKLQESMKDKDDAYAQGFSSGAQEYAKEPTVDLEAKWTQKEQRLVH